MYKSLQTFRAVAALSVVLFHIGGTMALPKYSGIAEFGIPFSFGHAGVNMFFVLSGFIIMWAHHADIDVPSRFSSYLRKRVIRIYPAYILIFSSVAISALMVPSLASAIPQDLGLLLKALLLVPLDKSEVGGTGAPVLIVAWSLQYEIFFYFLFGLFIYNRRLGYLAVTSTALIYLFFDHTDSYPMSFIGTGLWVVLFGVGVITAQISKSLTASAWVRRPKSWLFLGALLFGVACLFNVLFTKEASDNLFMHCAFGLGSAMMIFGAVLAEDQGYAIGTSHFWQLLGAASYSLYLLHFPMISVLLKGCKAAGLLDGQIGSTISFILVFAICTLTAVMFYLVIEKPLITWLSARWRSNV